MNEQMEFTAGDLWMNKWNSQLGTYEWTDRVQSGDLWLNKGYSQMGTYDWTNGIHSRGLMNEQMEFTAGDLLMSR